MQFRKARLGTLLPFQRFPLRITAVIILGISMAISSAPISDTWAWKEVTFLPSKWSCCQTMGNCLCFLASYRLPWLIKILILVWSLQLLWCAWERENVTCSFYTCSLPWDKCLWYEIQGTELLFGDWTQEEVRTVLFGDTSEDISAFSIWDWKSDTILAEY